MGTELGKNITVIGVITKEEENLFLVLIKVSLKKNLIGQNTLF